MATDEVQASLQVDDHDDNDSGFDEDGSSLQSASLKSSVLDYTYENGRRYHAYRAGEYPLPNDELEQSRMDLLHHIWRIMQGGDLLCKKPASPPDRILDIGTGTGIWAIDMADEYPESFVIGTDLSPIQPGWLPPNCKFYVDDAEDTWTYQPFDLIHGRSLCGCIADWPKFYRQCFDHLKPGGYLEMQEHDAWISSLNDEEPPWTYDWNRTLNRAAEIFGKPLHVVNNHVGWMKDAGFIDVEDQIHAIPIGSWAKTNKDLGRMHLLEISDAVDSYTLALYSKVLNKPLEETQIVIEMVKKEFRTKSFKLYGNYHFITARKPQ